MRSEGTSLVVAPYCVLGDQIVAVRPFLRERRLRASTRNGGRSAGHRGRGHRAVAFLRSGARRNCLVVAASRNGLGTRMGREGGSDVYRNRRSGAGAVVGGSVLMGVVLCASSAFLPHPGEPLGRCGPCHWTTSVRSVIRGWSTAVTTASSPSTVTQPARVARVRLRRAPRADLWPYCRTRPAFVS